MTILHTLFDWPNGIVVGNLIASAICVSLAAVHIERLMKRHHIQHIAILHRHHAEQLKEIKNVRLHDDPGRTSLLV